MDEGVYSGFVYIGNCIYYCCIGLLDVGRKSVDVCDIRSCIWDFVDWLDYCDVSFFV